MSAYYNEIDTQKAQWIRELIKAGVIAPGYVDERDIREIEVCDLYGYTQHHFFAGIGAWSYALRLAGWPDSKPCWTGSCPCPSFSAAGKGDGFADSRHLWPDWYKLICQYSPAVIFGEQVEAAIGHGWLDLVQTDMEAKGYAVGKAVLTAAGVGAPHIRARLYFVAHTERGAAERQRFDMGAEARSTEGAAQERERVRSDVGDGGAVGECADTEHDGHDTARGIAAKQDSNQPQERLPDGDYASGERSHAVSAGLEGHDGNERDGNRPGRLDAQQVRSIATASGATRGFWADCDWWYGRDGKWRPIGKGIRPLVFANSSVNGCRTRTCGDLDNDTGKSAQRGDGDRQTTGRNCDSGEGCESKNRQRPIEPGLQPLAHGAAARVLRLRGYGDAICVEAAKAFIQAAEGAIHDCN